jgi:hypothetical protein
MEGALPVVENTDPGDAISVFGGWRLRVLEREGKRRSTKFGGGNWFRPAICADGSIDLPSRHRGSPMTTIIWIVAIGVGAYFLFFRKGNSVRQPEPSVEAVEPVAAIPGPKLTPEEAEIAKARELGEAGSEARQQAFHEHKRGLREAEAKLAQADKFVRESGLDHAVPWLFEEMQHWPSWQSGPSDWKLPVDITEVEGEGEFGDRWISWNWADTKFKIHFTKHPDYGGLRDDTTELADFRVEVNGELVLEVNCSRDWSKEFDPWRYFSTDALKVGPWISKLVEFYQHTRLAHERNGYAVDAEYTLDRAKGIALGGAEPNEA